MDKMYWLDGIYEKQSKSLEVLLEKHNSYDFPRIREALGYQFSCQIFGLTALELISFFNDQSGAKIIACCYNQMQGKEAPISNWTLEVPATFWIQS